MSVSLEIVFMIIMHFLININEFNVKINKTSHDTPIISFL